MNSTASAKCEVCFDHTHHKTTTLGGCRVTRCLPIAPQTPQMLRKVVMRDSLIHYPHDTQRYRNRCVCGNGADKFFILRCVFRGGRSKSRPVLETDRAPPAKQTLIRNFAEIF